MHPTALIIRCHSSVFAASVYLPERFFVTLASSMEWKKNESKIKFNHPVEVALFEPIICFLLYNLFLISFNFVHIFIQLQESSCNLNIEKSIVLILMHDQKKAVVNGDSFSGFIRRAHSSDKNAFYQ